MGWGCANGARSAVREPVRIFELFCERTIPGRALVRRLHKMLIAGRRHGVMLLTLGCLALSAPVSAQPAFDSIALDRLQIQSLGLSAGRVAPSQLVPTNLYALQADYGPVGPGWRASFGVSFWDSRFRSGVVQAFVDSLQKSISEPSARVEPSRVSLYDVTFGLDLRYTPPTLNGAIRPFVGFGAAAHVINAEGKLIKGTFVERSLDEIGAGLFGTAGVTIRIIRHFGIEGSVRGDMLSAFRSTQARVGANYYFGRVRVMQPQ